METLLSDMIWNAVRNRQMDCVVDRVETRMDATLTRSITLDIESALLINVWDPVMDNFRDLKGAFDDTVTG